MKTKSYWKLGTTDRRTPHSYVHLQKRDVVYVGIAGLLAGLVAWVVYRMQQKSKQLPQEGTPS